MEPTKRKLEGPGHELRLEAIQECFRTLSENEIAAVRVEQRSWLQKPKREKSANIAIVGATTDAEPEMTHGLVKCDEQPLAPLTMVGGDTGTAPAEKTGRAKRAWAVTRLPFAIQVAGTIILAGGVAFAINLVMP